MTREDELLTELLHERELLRLQGMRERYGRIPWWERPKRLLRPSDLLKTRRAA